MKDIAAMKKTIKRRLALTIIAVLAVNLGVNGLTTTTTAANGQLTKLTLNSTEQTNLLWGASYLEPTGQKMIKIGGNFSINNGMTWFYRPPMPDFDSGLPPGSRGKYAPFVDPVNGNVITAVISLDVPVDPNDPEPPIGQEAYYLRYRVSTDGGVTNLFDTPMIQLGMTQANPFDGIHTGQNGYYIGDGSGDRIIRTQSGRIIVPAQSGVLDASGELWIYGAGTYTDAMMILGTWQADNTIEWSSAKFIKGFPTLSTRGMIEPTLTQMSDGKLLCVMRGSNGGANDPYYLLPGYRWYSVSSDDGDTWTTPRVWTYDNGDPFFSPSSCSHLMQHSSGRYFWIGNISPNNPQGNNPRYPLVIGEVDSQTLKLIESTLLEIDTKHPDEPGVNLSHMWVLEDRITHDIVVTGSRNSQDYTSSTPVTYRIGVAYYMPGDANMDGTVDAADATILADNWQTLSGATWAMGDFNGDYAVDDIDATLLAANWQNGVASTIPEPASFVLLGSALIPLLAYAWRKHGY